MKKLVNIVLIFLLSGCSSKAKDTVEIQPTATPPTPITTKCELLSDGIDFNIIVNGYVNSDVTDITLSVRSTYEELGATPEEMVGMNEFMAEYLSEVLASSLNIVDITNIKVDVDNLFDEVGLNYKATIPTNVLASALEINGDALTVETMQDELMSIGFACEAY